MKNLSTLNCSKMPTSNSFFSRNMLHGILILGLTKNSTLFSFFCLRKVVNVSFKRKTSKLCIFFSIKRQTSIRSLKTSITSLQSSITSLKTSITSLQSSIACLQTSITSLQSSITSLQTSIISLQTSITSLQSSITSLQTSITCLKTSSRCLKTSFISLSSFYPKPSKNRSLYITV